MGHVHDGSADPVLLLRPGALRSVIILGRTFRILLAIDLSAIL